MNLQTVSRVKDKAEPTVAGIALCATLPAAGLATRLPWWMDLLLAAFAYIGLHLWHGHFLSEMNQVTSPVSFPAKANPATAIPDAVNIGLDHGVIVVGSIFTQVFQYVVPALFVLGGIASAIREQKLKRMDRS